jgi:AraC-like DNA-binding protein
MTEFSFLDGRPLIFQAANEKTYRGIRLPGANLLQFADGGATIAIHEFRTDLFRLSLRSFHCTKEQSFRINEPEKFLKLQTVLTGEMLSSSGNTRQRLLSGLYCLSVEDNYVQTFNAGTGCQCLIIFLSPALMEQIPNGETIVPGEPVIMPAIMRGIVARMLENPYNREHHEGFYDHNVRELLFHHLSAPPFTAPGALSPEEIAAIHAADAIIRTNITRHYTIPQLARMVHVNTLLLKRGFSQIFGMGPFERLTSLRMEKAKHMLQHTDELIQDISEKTGFATTASFINAFRREFNISPRVWRMQKRNEL